MGNKVVSRYGVYRDLSKSPYVYKSPYGDLFRFRSKKKLDIYTRDIHGEIDRVSKFLGRRDLEYQLPREVVHILYRCTYQAFYEYVEG